MDALLKERVWQRAKGLCEYCHVPHAFDPVPYHIDHIIAQKHGGPTDAENLSLACFGCNNQKQSDIAGIDPDGSPDDPVRLFHPRKDSWHEHFEWEGPILRAKTPIGRVTLYVLGINLPHRVAFRRLLVAEGVFPPAGVGEPDGE